MAVRLTGAISPCISPPLRHIRPLGIALCWWLPNGLICLKGGEIQGEIAPVRRTAMIFDLKDYFDEEFFQTKKAVYVPI